MQFIEIPDASYIVGPNTYSPITLFLNIPVLWCSWFSDGSKDRGFPSVMFERQQTCVEFRKAGFRKCARAHTRAFSVCESLGW
jgi:hypothetical protein